MEKTIEKFYNMTAEIEDRSQHIRSNEDRKKLIEDIDKTLHMYKVLDELLAMDMAENDAGLL